MHAKARRFRFRCFRLVGRQVGVGHVRVVKCLSGVKCLETEVSGVTKV